MFKKVFKTALVAASSAVAVPYTVAFLVNLLYGWPTNCLERYYKSLHPRKVYALNYALLMELAKLKYLRLYIRWKLFYRTASGNATGRLTPDIEYGRNENRLDVYQPKSSTESGYNFEHLKPVVVFVYGGTWGSGDKNMYGLLCTHLADAMHAVVICPNYSIYPKGYVDDMVQDIGDVLSFIQQYGGQFGADKTRVALVGHSAGAHLAAMTIIDLTLKRLQDSPQSLVVPDTERSSETHGLEVSIVGGLTLPSIHFHDQHFNGTQRDRSEPSAATTSFYMVGDDGARTQTADTAAESFYFVEGQTILATGVSDDTMSSQQAAVTAGQDAVSTVKDELSRSRRGSSASDTDTRQYGDDRMVRSKSQKSLDDQLSSVKLVIGLAGVYDISQHYKFEEARGVEFISTMARAMYGSSHFDAFSPAIVARQKLPQNIRLPAIHLLHGDCDTVVPVSSSTQFGEVLWERGSRTVQVKVIPGCNHYDICLDLMDSSRRWHTVIIDEIMKSAMSIFVCTNPRF